MDVPSGCRVCSSITISWKDYDLVPSWKRLWSVKVEFFDSRSLRIHFAI